MAARPAARLNSALWGAALAGSAVGFGAFGAHALRAVLSPEYLAVFETGVRYQMYHGLALLVLGLYPQQRRGPLWLLIGTLIFSLSLYALALSGVRVLGAVTPIGGVIQLVGWGLVLLDSRRRRGAQRVGRD
ncbi:DUF423 domain-containing protein [Deinococcus sp.]|uniref:DUF423 domain-containing protein n=1 Tax=Deinococcus sp. TaxID=47478 RepID=UPI0025E4CF2C|nr:DUF423 domain-containing protein [Deinococcus sp.]